MMKIKKNNPKMGPVTNEHLGARIEHFGTLIERQGARLERIDTRIEQQGARIDTVADSLDNLARMVARGFAETAIKVDNLDMKISAYVSHWDESFTPTPNETQAALPLKLI